MIVYLDSDFKCHLADDGTMVSYETDLFDEKCRTYIEGYRLIPEGQTWTNPNGVTFKGLMMMPWKNYAVLEIAQLLYEEIMASTTGASVALDDVDNI